MHPALPAFYTIQPEIIYVREKELSKIETNLSQSHPHMHPDSVQLSIILKGNAHYTIKNKAYTIPQGSVVILNPGIYHSTSVPKQDCFQDLHIGLSNLFVSNHCSKYLNLSNDFLILPITDDPEGFFNRCHAFINEFRVQKEDYQLMLKTIILQLFILISRELHLQNTSTSTIKSDIPAEKRKVVDFMIHYINKNYMKDITLDMFAKDMYLSPVYISKIFKEETSLSPINYVIKTRLSKAKELLETCDLPVKTIAQQVGYDDVYHFSKLFKKYYGYPPSFVKK